MVLISRAPIRVSFGGDGTDLPAYAERNGGLVVSATVGYYVYTMLTPGPSHEVQIISADHQALLGRLICEDLSWSADLGLPRAIIDYFNLRGDLTVFLASQSPPGSGLGSSGSVAVSLVKGLAFWCGLDMGPAEVAELACHIEIEKMKMPVGRQDPYAAAFGGLNRITFSRHDVVVEPLQIADETYEALGRELMLFFTGASCQSSAILTRQKEACEAGDKATLRLLGTLKELAQETCAALEQGDLQAFGALLDRSWAAKRQLVEGITNPSLDRYYEVARRRGVSGGMVTGAGGGGFLMLCCPPDRQEAVTGALQELGLRRWPLDLDTRGVEVMEAVSWSRPQTSRSVFLRRRDAMRDGE